MEWTEALKNLAAPVDYKRGDGVAGKYCRFASLEAFCGGYWARFALDGRFAELPAHAASAVDFLRHIAPIPRPDDRDYAAKVLNILARLQAALAPRPDAGPTPGPQPGTPPVAEVPSLQDGFVIHVRRPHTEQRAGKKHRTAGSYQVFFNGQKLDGLEGMSFETWGPGDNTTRGVRNARRLEAKIYPLFTHLGSKTVPGVNGVPEDPNLVSGEEAYDLIAATMNGAASPLLISHARFLKLAGQRSDILSLRGYAGQNLWSEWAGGWEASFAIEGEAARNFIQAELVKIADALTGAGLSINDDAGLLTPLTEAASGDEFRAVKALHAAS